MIVNPAAGGGRALRAEARVAKLLRMRGHAADFTRSKSSEDLREQAERGAREGYRYVVALGGDGAFHHLVEALHGTEAVAGFFPAGNGNDIAADLGIPADPLDAAEAFLKSAPRAIDLIRAQFGDGPTAHYIGAGGMGLDAEAAHLANTKFKRLPGVTRYLVGALWEFFHGGSIGLHAEIDGVAWDGRALFVAVANSTRYGSGIRIAPEAKMDDGWIDVALVQEVRLIQARGSYSDCFDFGRFTRISGSAAVPMQTDRAADRASREGARRRRAAWRNPGGAYGAAASRARDDAEGA